MVQSRGNWRDLVSAARSGPGRVRLPAHEDLPQLGQRVPMTFMSNRTARPRSSAQRSNTGLSGPVRLRLSCERTVERRARAPGIARASSGASSRGSGAKGQTRPAKRDACMASCVKAALRASSSRRRFAGPAQPRGVFCGATRLSWGKSSTGCTSGATRTSGSSVRTASACARIQSTVAFRPL